MMQESYNAADELISALLAKGYDYSEYREQIAREAFDEGLFSGNWDVLVSIDGEDDLRLINEDEYDQHMDEGDKPDFDMQDAYLATGCCYVWMV